MRESERGSSTHSTAVGSLQYFLILTAVQRQAAVAPDPSFRPQRFSAELGKGQIFLVSCASGHSGRGQALGKCPAPNTCTLAYKQPCSKRAPPRWGCPSPESRNGRSKPPWSPPLPQPPLQP
ncbi:unnamed protein product [Pleuronectes platessa]|uniref:Uncharacterized protein n=1 Tax=Pleuronectes platessa TaxID=8262 RepID=A0A9N7VXF3_PLEPL|nr:unnamed protein product [Pleuronectes platessa]